MTHKSEYEEYVGRKQSAYGSKFDDGQLAPQFRPFFHTGQRVRVRFEHGEELTGTIGATTGWRPCFLLMRRSDSIGSPYTLSDKDEIVAVQIRGRYVDTR